MIRYLQFILVHFLQHCSVYIAVSKHLHIAVNIHRGHPVDHIIDGPVFQGLKYNTTLCFFLEKLCLKDRVWL